MSNDKKLKMLEEWRLSIILEQCRLFSELIQLMKAEFTIREMQQEIINTRKRP
jgi:hypothetical protein